MSVKQVGAEPTLPNHAVARRHIDVFGGVAAQAYKVGPAFHNARTEPLRILLSGTSVASFATSGPRVAIEQLRKQYGSNKTSIYSYGSHLGGYTPTGGYRKQPFGGSTYSRLVMEPGQANIERAGWCERIVFVYSKEADGAAFNIFVDGVNQNANLTSNGAQANELIWSITFPKAGVHTFSVSAPATGFAYLQRVEFQDLGPGVFVEDGTLGGAGLYHTLQLKDKGDAGNRDGIPIVGNSGVDAWFNRTGLTRAKLIICEHFINDGTTELFKQALDRAVATTKANEDILVLVSEQPAIPHLSTDGVLITQKQDLLNIMWATANANKHVAMVDWVQMVDYSNRDAYQAKYYASGDVTHPDTKAYAPVQAALALLFNTEQAGANSVLTVPGATVPIEAMGINPFVPDPYGLAPAPRGAQQAGGGVYGGILTVIGRAINMLYSNLLANIYSSDTVLNLVNPEWIAAINNSVTSDKYGPYITIAGSPTTVAEGQPWASMAMTDEFTYVFLAESTAPDGRISAALNDSSSGTKQNLTINGVNQVVTNNQMSIYGLNDGPAFFYFTFRRGRTDLKMNMNLLVSNMNVYGVWLAEGPLPILSQRLVKTARFEGTPVLVVGDPDTSLVNVGQILYELQGTIYICKEATRAVFWKPFENKFTRGYKLLNPAEVKYWRLIPVTGGTITRNERWGGDQSSVAVIQSASLATTLAAQRVTLAFRCNGAYGWFKIQLIGNGNTWSLTATGTWIQNSSETLQYENGFAEGGNTAFSFNLPSGTTATSLGTTAVLRVEGIAGNPSAPGVLALGNSALII